jgi:hypothetical protein
MKRALALAIVLLAAPAGANDAEMCAKAYERGQELRLGHKLAAAREDFLVCARPMCPKAARDDCSKWLGEVEASLAGVVVRASQAGAAFDDARVLVDGAVAAERIDARPITLDPGKHVVRVEPRGCAPHQSEVTVASGRTETVAFDVCGEPKPVAPVTVVVKHPPIATFVFGGLGIAALATFAIVGGVGASDANNLKNTCYPGCPQSDVDRANTELAIADVALGITVACAAIATVWWLVAPRTTTKTVALTSWRLEF